MAGCRGGTRCLALGWDVNTEYNIATFPHLLLADTLAADPVMKAAVPGAAAQAGGGAAARTHGQQNIFLLLLQLFILTRQIIFKLSS